SDPSYSGSSAGPRPTVQRVLPAALGSTGSAAVTEPASASGDRACAPAGVATPKSAGAAKRAAAIPACIVCFIMVSPGTATGGFVASLAV
ncbi:MAG TPA: hypothetical protein PK562_04680, partial [Candidatus Omnitrophota bacterium]|nr:hypothetical protein [Candidatus Omnitrophota bacterium]